MTPSCRRLVVAVVALLLTPVVLSAQAPAPPQAPQQQPPIRPTGALFGAARRDARPKTNLDFTATLLEGYDNDVPATVQSTFNPSNVQFGGLSTTLNATAAYVYRGTRTQVGANATSALRYYNDLRETRSVGHSAGAGIYTELPAHFTLNANQAAAYSPTYFYGLFPTEPVTEPGNPGTTAPDYSVSEFESYTYTTTMSLRRDFSRRTNVVLSGDFQYVDRLRESIRWQDVNAHWLRGQYWRNIARNTMINVQYRLRSGEFGYGGEAITTEHGVDFGVSYSKPLSATRRAVFRFSLGASAARIPQTVGEERIIRHQYLGVGDISADYQFGRSWDVRGNFRRGVEYVADIPVPVFADSFSVGIDGFLTTRFDFSGSAGYSSGVSLLNRSSTMFDTYTGTLRMRYALTRQVAAYSEYLYYFYDFREGTPLLAGIPRGLERSGVRAGLTLWMNALRR